MAIYPDISSEMPEGCSGIRLSVMISQKHGCYEWDIKIIQLANIENKQKKNNLSGRKL